MTANFYPFSRSLYDDCNIEKKNLESTGPFKYMTEPVHESKADCFLNATPFQHNTFRNIPSASIDIDSDLRNQTRLLSRCPETRFDPTKLDNCQKCEKCNSGLPCDCAHCKQTKYENKLKNCENNGLTPAYTRVKKPCNIFSGITINRFNPLFEDLQDANKIQSNSFIGTNTRLLVKDAFKPTQPTRN